MNYTNYIEFDKRDGSLCLAERPSGETPFDVFHGLVEQFVLPGSMEYDDEEIVAWFRERYEDELKEIMESGEEAWNGSNWVWRSSADWNDSNHSPIMKIEDDINDLSRNGQIPGKEIWDATDWWLGGMSIEQAAAEIGITAKTTNDELDCLADKAQQIVEMEGSTPEGQSIVIEGMATFCERLREHMIEQADEADEED